MERMHENVIDLRVTYSESVNFYTNLPSGSISLNDFEKVSIERIKILRIIEHVNHVRQTPKYSRDYYEAIQSFINPTEHPTYDVLLGRQADWYGEDELLHARMIDHTSHFILRLVFSRTPELIRWFIALEVDLFLLRLCSHYHNYDRILERYNIDVEKVELDKHEYREEIMNGCETLGNTHVYKTHFLQVPHLISQRNVFLLEGYAYIPYHELPTVFASKFRNLLHEVLMLTRKNIHLLDDERIVPIIRALETRSYSFIQDSKMFKNFNFGEAISASQLSIVSKSFPLCMRTLYDEIKERHHLRHGGRLQLGLFFKGIGLPLEGSTDFWRENLTKNPEIDLSRFESQYAYNIRHMYGKEGKRADYTPFTCAKVINLNVGGGENHGCPFRHFDNAHLVNILTQTGVSKKGIDEIGEHVKDRRYQLACSSYFRDTHQQEGEIWEVSHPNEYYVKSRKFYNSKLTKSNDQGGQGEAGLRVVPVTSGTSEDVKSGIDSDFEKMLEEMDY